MSGDGTMARRDELLAFAARHGIIASSVAQLIAYRSQEEAAERKPARSGTARRQRSAGS